MSTLFTHACPLTALRFDLDWCAHVYKQPDLVDLLVRHGDTAVRPIVQAMGASAPAKFRAESVNLHVTAGTHTQLRRSLPVRRIWLREVERAMKLAVRNLAIEGVL